MLNYRFPAWRSILGAVVLTSAISAGVGAQTMRTQEGATTASAGEMRTETLALPTGERDSSVLLIERSAPAEVRLGQATRYTLKVTNLSDNALGQVVVSESVAPGVEIQSSEPPHQMAGGQGQQQQRQRQQQQRQRMQQPQEGQPAQQPQSQQQQGQQRQPQQGQQQLRMAQWHIGSLAGNESRTIQVTSIASQLGTVNTCMWASYFPAVCTTMEVVQPSLELQAQLINVDANAISICEPPTIQYTVRNSGTGVAENVQVIHPLPEGLTSSDGQSTVVLPIGELQAGQERQLTAQVKAERTGEFTTRAYAQSSSDDAYSSEIQMLIREPRLEMQITGPDQVVLGESVRFRVDMRNTGDIATSNAVLALQTDGIDAADRNRNIGELAPGATQAFDVIVRQTGPESVNLAATLSSPCAEDATSSATTRIQTLPALRVSMVDRVDPVKNGENTVYEITVRNQGNAAATNVALRGTVPPELEFVEGSGKTEVSGQGREIQFAPVQSLAPQEMATWYVTAKGVQPGDARFRVEMMSDTLDEPVISEESTRIY